jgi:hypothetical protein
MLRILEGLLCPMLRYGRYSTGYACINIRLVQNSKITQESDGVATLKDPNGHIVSHFISHILLRIC